MKNFEFANPTKILFGKGQIAKLPQVIPTGAKVLLIFGGGSVKKTGLLGEVKQVLKNYQLGEFGGIEPNPAYETLMLAVETIRRENYDYLLAIGGGSVIDGTKFIAAAVPFTQGDPWRIVSEQLPVTEAVPFGTIVTLPATGSEMNPTAVVSRLSLKAKLAFASPAVYPRFSVLDPVYTYSLPDRQIGNGVVDAFIHVMEQYMTYPVDAKVQDRFAEGLLLTLIEEGPKALAEPESYDVRANVMWAATWGLNGFIGQGVPQDWATHMIGHEITALYGLDHAQTLAIVLPALLTVRKQQKQAKLLQYAERVWQLTAGDDAERAEQAIAKTKAFFETMGLPTALSKYDLGAEAIEAVAASLKQHGMVKLGENRDITPDVVKKILEQAL
ncbi:MAG: iron-containing alcohol dehydrogenase [Sporomusaceae bacterium]|nr:iron-containing alcohol dehydrogenase [Sporomusaceae bacterium]